MFLEKLVGQDAGLGKAPHGVAHFVINVSDEDFVLQGILFNDPWGKQGERYLHVFKSVKWGGKVKFFMSRHIYLAAGVLSTLF